MENQKLNSVIKATTRVIKKLKKKNRGKTQRITRQAQNSIQRGHGSEKKLINAHKVIRVERYKGEGSKGKRIKTVKKRNHSEKENFLGWCTKVIISLTILQ